jgi:hypothetical protein
VSGKIFITILVIAVYVLSGCREAPTAPAAPPKEGVVVQLSDFPLYEYHYPGDYGFAEYLKVGVSSCSPGFETWDGTPGLESWATNLKVGASSCSPGFETWDGTPGLESWATRSAFACSTFAAAGDPDQHIFGRNFDWYANPALVLFTDSPDGFASISLVDLSYLGYTDSHTPLADTAGLKDAPYLPFDGMNEHGLAVGMMAVDHAEGSADPEKATIEDIPLIRLLLDYAREVDEALALLRKVNVRFGSVPIHYLIADAKGDSALVEYLDGEMVITRGAADFQVATNFIVAEVNPVGDDAPCWRYQSLYRALEKSGGKADSASGMALLQEVSQGGGETSTRWSAVYDLTHRTLRLALGRDYQTVYEFKLSSRK